MGIKERKLRDHENRKNLILDTARELFAQKGFASVTLEDIAAKIEFSKATLYSHFESKEEMYAQILLIQLDSLLEMLRQSVFTSQTAFEGIRSCLEVYTRFYRQYPEYFQLLFFVDIFSNHYRIPEQLLQKIQTQKVACLLEVQKVLTRGMSANQLQKKYSAKGLAFVLWGMLNGLLQLTESHQVRKQELDSLINMALEIVMRGLQEPQKIN